ncbi:MAG: hypothetical protein Q3Y13_02805 [Sutterella sp.]|nr:hypothetical protein [Sutterella sp.]
MKNTRRIIAALAAVGTMALGTAFAAPAAPAPQPQPPQVTAPYYQGYAAIENILTLTAEQKPLWDAYVAARIGYQTDRPVFQGPAADEQSRLDRRVERSQWCAGQLKKIRDARAALVKSLSVEQKYVLESYEYNHRGQMGPRANRGPGCGVDMGPRGFYHGYGPHHGYGPMGPRGMGPGMGPHHGMGPGMGWGPGTGPHCPWVK